MENSRKTQLTQYLNNLKSQYTRAESLTPELFNAVSQQWFTEHENTLNKVTNATIYVPVVGSFSTGKSTALNQLIGKDILPEKVSPETAIPAEIHFAETEKILALSQNNQWSEHSITSLADLSANAQDYQVVQIFVNSPFIKSIQPLTLVDMPGFDSGLTQHNDAILRYITTGALYFYFVSATAGTISKQDQRRIAEIINLGRSVNAFITMSDLINPTDLAKIKLQISEQIDELTNSEQVELINKEDVTALKQSLLEANIDQLTDNLVLPSIRDNYFNASAHLNAAINGLTGTSNQVAQKIETASNSLLNAEEEFKKQQNENSRGLLTQKADNILHKLETDLRNSLEELVSIAKVNKTRGQVLTFAIILLF